MSRVVNYLADSYWLIQSAALHMICSIAQRDNLPVESIEKELGSRLDNTRSVRVRDGIAIIPVTGPLFRRANMFTEISGATSLEVLGREFSTALSDIQVRGIILEVDSPGGEVNGTQELAEMIFQARGVKPITSFVSGSGTSGALWVASAADRVVMGSTAIMGSVGAVLQVVDHAGADEKRGIRTLEIVSTQSPRKRLDPFDSDPEKADEAHAELQRLVDGFAREFVSDVARNRAVSVDEVLARFGGGSIFVGQDAVDRGMADSIGTLESLITSMSEPSGGRPGTGLRLSAGLVPGTSHPEGSMSDNQANPAPAPEPVIDRGFLDANHANLVAEIQAEAATAERDRILEINALPGPEDLRKACVEDSSVTAGDAALKLIAAQAAADEARGKIHLDSRGAAENGIQAPGPSGDVDSGDAQQLVARMTSIHRSLNGETATAN